ncbi:MAG: DVU0298 family protein [Thermodesulfobacteriota bacterium]
MGRAVKEGVAAALADTRPLEDALAPFGRKAASPLIGFLCATDPRLRWRAVEGLGRVAAEMGRSDREAVRVILRRLWWMLNDESGGIGWGAPEALAEIIARGAPALADEFGKLLLSLLNPEGNFLELPVLRKGAVWGAGRLCRVRPELCSGAERHISPGLSSPDPEGRGFAAWALAAFAKLPGGAEAILQGLADDPSEILLYTGDALAVTTVGRLAQAALAGRARP